MAEKYNTGNALPNLPGRTSVSFSSNENRLGGLIVRVRVVPRSTVVGDIDRRFDNLSGSHHQSHVNCVSSVYGIYVSSQLSRDVIGCFKSNRWLSRDVINRAAMGRTRFLLYRYFIFFNRAAMGRARFLLCTWFIIFFFVGDLAQASTRPNRQRDFKSRN